MKFWLRILLGVGIVLAPHFVGAQSAATPPANAPAALAGTLAYHLATNAVGYSLRGSDQTVLAHWSYANYSKTNLGLLTNAIWSPTCWLRGVKGLSATCIGFQDGLGGQGLVTMVSPRHYLFATHMHPEGFRAAFLDVSNHIFWRKTLGRADIIGDVSVGILDQDLPKSVGFLPILPADYADYIPANVNAAVQGIGMNQDMRLFGEPMCFGVTNLVLWDSHLAVPHGLGTNWNVMIRGGDSSDPAMLLIGDQLVLVSHNFVIGGGPNYASRAEAINQAMHQLSKKHYARTDYQLTTISLSEWTPINR